MRVLVAPECLELMEDPRDGSSSARFSITNQLAFSVAFRVKSNAAAHYTVSQESGIVASGESVSIRVDADNAAARAVEDDQFKLIFTAVGLGVAIDPEYLHVRREHSASTSRCRSLARAACRAPLLCVPFLAGIALLRGLRVSSTEVEGINTSLLLAFVLGWVVSIVQLALVL